MVLIDSINGYLHAIPQSDAPLARMHELLSFLNERGVATILVAGAARHHRHDDGRRRSTSATWPTP